MISSTHQSYLAVLCESLAQVLYRVVIVSEPQTLTLCVTRSVLNWQLWCANYVTFYADLIRGGL